MSSTIETGNAKNVATFEDVIGYCTGYGATYNPTKSALKLTTLNTLLTVANTSLQTVKTAKAAFDNATNAREISFSVLRSLATKVVNALAATDAAKQTIDDARSINNKIQGRRVKAITQPEAVPGAPAPAPVKKASVSQQSYDNQTDHFAQLITIVSAEPLYTPNESNLKITGLNSTLTDFKTKNSAVITTGTALSNARIARDKTLYAPGTGMVDVALAAKQYIKSVYGATSPQYKQVSILKFAKPSLD